MVLLMISTKATETIDQLLTLTFIPPNVISMFSNSQSVWLLIISNICEQSCLNYFMGNVYGFVFSKTHLLLNTITNQPRALKPLDNHFIFAYFLFYLLTKMLMFIICLCCCCYCYPTDWLNNTL